MSRTNLYGWICCALCNVKSVLLIQASWIAYPPIIVYDLLILQWLSLTICHTTIILLSLSFSACLHRVYLIVQATFASSAVLSIENRRKLAVHCGHSGGSVSSSDLTHSERWCDESCKMFVVLRPEVIKLLASLLQRSRIGSPVPEDCESLCYLPFIFVNSFKLPLLSMWILSVLAFHRNLQAFTTRTHCTVNSMWLAVMQSSLHTLRGSRKTW